VTCIIIYSLRFIYFLIKYQEDNKDINIIITPYKFYLINKLNTKILININIITFKLTTFILSNKVEINIKIKIKNIRKILNRLFI